MLNPWQMTPNIYKAYSMPGTNKLAALCRGVLNRMRTRASTLSSNKVSNLSSNRVSNLSSSKASTLSSNRAGIYPRNRAV